MLSKYYQIKENLIENDKNIYYLIKIFSLQNIYSFHNFNLLNNNENTINYTLIIELFNVYNNTENELLDLYNYIKDNIPKNSIPFEYFIKIYANNKRSLSEQLIKLFVDNLLKIPSSNDHINYINCYSLIIMFKLDKYFPQFNRNEFLKKLVYNLNYKGTAFRIIQNFNNEEIMSLDKSLLKEMLYSTNYERVKQVSFLLKCLPEEIETVIKDYIDNKKKWN